MGASLFIVGAFIGVTLAAALVARSAAKRAEQAAGRAEAAQAAMGDAFKRHVEDIQGERL